MIVFGDATIDYFYPVSIDGEPAPGCPVWRREVNPESIEEWLHINQTAIDAFISDWEKLLDF